MNKYAVINMDTGRIVASSNNSTDLLTCIRVYRKAGFEVVLVKILEDNLWEFVDEEV